MIVRFRNNVTLESKGEHRSIRSPEGRIDDLVWPEQLNPDLMKRGADLNALGKKLRDTEPFLWLKISTALSKMSAFIEYCALEGEKIVARYARRGMQSSSVIFGIPGRSGDYCISPNAFLRFVDGQFQIEIAGIPAVLFIYDLSVLNVFLSFRDAHPIDKKTHDGDAIQEILAFFVDAEALVSCQTLEADASRWEFHDVLFHGRSRWGGHLNGYGATWRFGSQPAKIKPGPSASARSRIALSRDHTERRHTFTEVLASRRTIRTHGPNIITKAQLSGFLQRTAELRLTHGVDAGGGKLGAFPSGGNLHELEIFPIIGRCAEITRAAYWYDRFNHQLDYCSVDDDYVARILDLARRGMQQDDEPQVLLVICSRMERVQAKYESMAYALTLKNLGVLLQTMYLVATDMGLAPCALGGGPPTFRYERSGHIYNETCIGEFALGAL